MYLHILYIIPKQVHPSIHQSLYATSHHHTEQSSTCISSNTFRSSQFEAYTLLNVCIGKTNFIFNIVFHLFIYSIIFLEGVLLNGVVGDILSHSSSSKFDPYIPLSKWIHYKHFFVYFVVFCYICCVIEINMIHFMRLLFLYAYTHFQCIMELSKKR